MADELRYTLIEPASTGRARFLFTGRFENLDVLWDATLLALINPPSDPVRPAPFGSRQFIDIGEMTTRGRALTVGLFVPGIDEGVIRRTIIMIRQYKRLRHGRHEFGEALPTSPPDQL